ncbi:MAG TPA: ADP-forming succinate--CoA ligase subunit beta [Marinilabiliales bacterium]|jgi:succinyl-CoA synthetase beta subunit|nr:MAG: succinate--CoA ligase subunit beta [Bacteroidetes bacterium GWA2_40_14]OFX56768.1 MAG: succinate--CoA ligase subunit beta [Bacteroidetes bacterium GWC2_40_13]OFX72865.1 MAG: succinate--CoA ligase subunit beta [Bacteroidetes bacterium GWD2_40_43]OFX93558.1 MAG: succinate--CoA ligase subunit beta [Bacteroidetes bacterium GWE2_40_63]OFY18292.1 MAG: succinate--CoA ligase subunit beta [Bacteroidetes bacterium GWF2_40_13]OFZ27526.1 MAG: succinate--CoA ligase subunit beta [Bacteroidetes bacte
MKIHEYQAKEIFAAYQIPVQEQVVCTTVEQVGKAYDSMNHPVVVKAQVLVGGRGKAGGIKYCTSKEKAVDAAKNILGMDIKGLTVETVLVCKAVDIANEYYVGLINDRNTKSVLLMVSAEGGVEIEEVAKTHPEKILKIAIDPLVGLQPHQARNVFFKFMKDGNQVRQAADILVKLYKLYVEKDCSLAEINPLVIDNQNNVIALDAKVNFDDNALFRHPEYDAMADYTEDEKLEVDAKEKGLSYIKLDGNIGCMVNGAGLAMATMDMIKLYGGEPANFLDIGGSSNPKKVVHAMEYLVNDKKVKAVLINIFGGITRCDDVARGLLEAFSQMKVTIPIVIRLSGTNAEQGRGLLANNKELITADSMGEAARKVIEAAKKVK